MSNKGDSLVSGAKFFKVKEAKGLKMKSVLLGISKTDIIKMDKKTNEILETWPLEDVKRWAGSPKTFALDFGDEKYTVRTPDGDGERMSRLVSKNKPSTLPRTMSPSDPNSPMWKTNSLPGSNGSSPGPWTAPLPTPMVPTSRIIDRSPVNITPRMVVEPSTVPAPATATIIEKKNEPKRKRPARDPSPELDKRSSTESVAVDVYSPPKYETTITHETVVKHEPSVKKEPKKVVKYDIQKIQGQAIVNLPPPEKKKKKTVKDTEYEYIVEQHTKEVHYGIEKKSGKSIINLEALKPKKKKVELEPMEKEEPEEKVKERVEKEEIDPVNEEFFKKLNEEYLKGIEAPTITRTMVPIIPTVEDEAVEEDIAVDDVSLNFCAFFRKYGDLEPAEVPEVELHEKGRAEMPEMDVDAVPVVEDEIIPEKVVNEKKIVPEVVYPVYDEFFRNYPEMLPEKEEPVVKEEPKSEELMLRRKEEEPELDPRQRRVVEPAPPEDDPLTNTKLRLVKETREFHRSATKVVIITTTSTKSTTIVSAEAKASSKIVSKLISTEHFSRAESLAESAEKVEVAAIEIKSLAKEVSARAEGVNNEVAELVVGYSEELAEMLEVAIEFCEMAEDKLQMAYVLALVKEVCIAASTLLDNARKLIEEPDKPRHKIALAMSAKGVTNNISDFLDAVLNWPIEPKYDGFDAQGRTDDLMDTLGLKDKDRNNDTNLQRQLRDRAEDMEKYWKNGDPNYKGYKYPTYKDEIYGEGQDRPRESDSNNRDGSDAKYDSNNRDGSDAKYDSNNRDGSDAKYDSNNRDGSDAKYDSNNRDGSDAKYKNELDGEKTTA
ncbi:PREDICTED: titin-like isoform X4 [Branchiostoma belcheri]|uniref:Titin-like isoform X4 n=1 Tax=Branchiostoma belcheri TaxID=7741 RepID=A0A6P4ZQ78_BRABE|nr:PREDICTED: titin-like isoform X4 [Branchiostoma belcheri]